ncbi:MAG: YbaB/EbfC family nucleoid-associated protein [Wenzhouxiangellaceae bacterium]|nr:YbaB/EbfC family nucleoid-associated protein [Wenzhouxiangellaceae bacterium]
MKAGIGQLMQQAQKMQENLKRAQEELAALEVTGSAGGGMVEISMNGRHEVRRVRLEPGAAEDVEMLEDLLTAAFNDAVNKVAESSQKKVSELAGGLPLPPGFTLP